MVPFCFKSAHFRLSIKAPLTGTSFSAGGETKISWLFSKTEQGLGCCSPPGMSRWLLGYSHHGRPGSCKPTGCPGRSGCNPCPPTPHWPLTVWNILPSTDLHCYDYPRRHYRTRAAVPRCQPPPPIDQTTVYQNHQLGTGGSILNIITLASLKRISEVIKANIKPLLIFLSIKTENQW